MREKLLNQKKDVIRRIKIQAQRIAVCDDEREIQQVIENLNTLSLQISKINYAIFIEKPMEAKR